MGASTSFSAGRLLSWDIFFVFFGIGLAVFVYYPFHDFIPLLSEGDRGRDFYMYYRTLQGDIPYRDYYTLHGPLGPFFYTFCMKVLGVSIPSVLMGEIFLKILGGVILYASLRHFVEPPVAFVAAVWFWAFNPAFFQTANAVPGVTGILAALFFIFRYIRDPRRRWVYFMMPCLLAVFLTKYNIGICLFASTGISIFLVDLFLHRRSFSKTLLNLVPFFFTLAVGLLVYWFFMRGLSWHYIWQCLRVPGNDYFRNPFKGRLLTLFYYFRENTKGAFFINFKNFEWSGSWVVGVGAVILTAGAAFVTYESKAGKFQIDFKKMAFALLAVLLVSLLNLHEFFLGNWNYRVFWVTPTVFLLVFPIIGTLMRFWHPALKIGTILFLLLAAFMNVQPKYELKANTVRYKNFLFLPEKNAQVYVNNPIPWIKTVRATTKYLEDNLAPEETFLSLPNQPIYHYLTGRKNPILQDEFYKYMRVTPEQEKEMIAQLEAERVNYAIFSNRGFNSPDPDIGVFGQTHGRLLWDYIQKNFRPVATIGDWNKEGVWAMGHAIRIYRRNGV